MGRIRTGSFLKVSLLSIFILFSGLITCGKEKLEDTIQLPSTSVLSIRTTWGVVVSNYLRMRTNPSRDSGVLDGLTKATVVKVLSSTEKEEAIETETAYWYRVDLDGMKGWVFGAYLRIFDSELKAIEFAREIK